MPGSETYYCNKCEWAGPVPKMVRTEKLISGSRITDGFTFARNAETAFHYLKEGNLK
jgi:hypothetical protein